MFGLGGSPTKKPTAEPRSSGSNKKKKQPKKSQKKQPDSPNSHHSAMSSGSDSLQEEQRPSSGGFLSNWTGRATKKPEPSVSASHSEHSEDESSESSGMGSSYDSAEHSHLHSHSASSASHSGSSHGSYSEVDSPGLSGSDDQPIDKIHSSNLDSSVQSPESLLLSQESSSMMLSRSHSQTDTTTSPAPMLLVPFKTSHSLDLASTFSPAQDSNNMMTIKTDESGESTEISLTMASSDSTAPTAKTQQTRFSTNTTKTDLFHLIPPRLTSISEAASLESAEKPIFSGEDADDEATMFSVGGDSTLGPTTTLEQTLTDATDTAGNQDNTSLDQGGKSASEILSHLAESPTVGPNLTSSTLHSGSTVQQGFANNKSKPKKSMIQDPVPEYKPSPEEDSVREIGLALEKAKGEYEMGAETNRRYRTIASAHPQVETMEPGVTPSFMNRNEIFHKTASAAIAAMLAPRDPNTSLRRVGSKEQGDAFATVRYTGSSNNMEIKNTFSGQQSAPGSASAFHPPTDGNTQDASMQSFGRRDVSEVLINARTEQKLESLENRMLDPTKTLADLLTAIATPDDKSKMDLGFMVRRKNACGAIKVMTNDPRKRKRICWTIGVLSALTSVLMDSLDGEGILTGPDKRVRFEYEAARNRAISALLNLSMPKENRVAVFHTPGLVQAMHYLIDKDQDTARRGCTAILAYLAKSPENRLLMAQIPGFFDALVPILRPRPPRLESRVSPPAASKKKYSWVSEEERESDDSNSESQSRNQRSVSSDDSQITPKIAASQSPVELTGYDETADDMLRATRQNVFALIGHLSKEKDNAYHFARDAPLMRTMVQIAEFHESPAHVLAVKFLANLSRHRLNTKLMVFQERATVPALVKAANSEYDETRLYACYAIQNMAQDKSCRQELAGVEGLVTTLCSRGRYAQAEEERSSAISAIKNLCDEPANLIPLTNTPECIATLMHLAHGREEGVTEIMQYRACDALATLSHWLRKIATSGKALDDLQQGVPPAPERSLFVPSLRVVTWNQWQ